MGGGGSSPTNTQNNGITLSGNYGDNSKTTYDNLHTGGSTSTQGATSTGATVGVKGSYSGPVPVLQNLYEKNCNAAVCSGGSGHSYLMNLYTECPT